MKVFDITDINEIEMDDIKRVVALGFFDGLHKGHREIINRVITESKDRKIVSSLITFDISPKEFFSKKKVKLLTPRNQKIAILENLGLDEVYILKFNEQLSEITREEFVDNVLKKINTTSVYCGEDYLFGNSGKGTPDFIKKYTDGKIKVNVVETIKSEDERKVSSSDLRSLIKLGEVSEYRKKSGVCYSITGQVVKGKQLGRTISFPTANLKLEEEYVLPEQLGVYITKVRIQEKYYKGITNIGKNPTVSDEKKLNIETHILDFNREIYGEKIEIEFYDFIRVEKKFAGLSELKEQLKKDKEAAEQFSIKLSIEKM